MVELTTVPMLLMLIKQGTRCCGTFFLFTLLPLFVLYLGAPQYSYAASLPEINIVSLSPQRFNPSNNEKVTLYISSSQDGQAIVRIYDRLYYQLREFTFESIEANQSFAVIWDGRDQSGVVVPDESYFFTVEVWDQQGRSKEYNPSVSMLTSAVPIFAQYDNHSKTVNFNLQQDSVVDIRAGIADGGPLMIKLIEWKPLLKGQHRIAWDGWDASHTLRIVDHPKQHLFTQIAPLPENSLFTYGNAALGERLYSDIIDQEHLKPRGQIKGNNTLYSQLDILPYKNINPEFTLEFPGKHNKAGLALLQGEVPLTVRLKETIKQRVTETRYEILVFIDNTFVTEIEEGRSPARIMLDTTALAEGEHWVTVNVVTLQGGLATASQRFIKTN